MLTSFSFTEDEVAPVVKKKKVKNTKAVARQKWSHEEEKEIEKLLSKCFQTGKGPSQHECEEAMKASKAKGGLIWKRPRDNIKKKVFNMKKCKK